jgi:pimeloyl-ACP methyl ester carboxylesterase
VKYFVLPSEDRRLDSRSRDVLRGSYIDLTDGVTHYELTGPEAGELFVLTPGLTIPLFYWDGLAAELHTRGFRTLAYSAYGRGYSDRVKDTYDLALFVRQLNELVEALGLGSHHLVGTSMGALVAMAYVPGRRDVQTLTLSGPAGLAKAPPTRSLLTSGRKAALVGRRLGSRLLQSHMRHNVRDEASASALADMVNDAFRYEGSMYALFSTLQNLPLHGQLDLFRSTGNLGVPAMLLWGDDDQVTPVSGLAAACDLLRPREHHVIRECGHMAPLERPREVADLISSFATSSRRVGS